MMTHEPATDALFCDEYELTMAQSFWRHQQDELVVFELFVRELPLNRGYLVVAGLDCALDYLEALHFDGDDLAYLGDAGYDPAFIEELGSLRFTGSLQGIAEGTVVGAGVPLLQLRARRLEATVVESALLAIINHQTMIATKAARICGAAAGRPVWDFSLRRLHGIRAGLGVGRASYIGGCAGTATVAAAARYAVPTTGTMAHHYIQLHGESGEQQAFEQFLTDSPERGVLLVDTYSTERGVTRAIEAARATGVKLRGIRLDSGDLNAEARSARAALDAAGMTTTTIVASGDLDEYRINELVSGGAPIDSFGVGTMLGTSADAPALSGVYKLVAQQHDGLMTATMKLSEHKLNDPGVHQVYRTRAGDVIALADEPAQGEPLLQQVVRDGRRLQPALALANVRQHCLEQLASLPDASRRLVNPTALVVRRSEALRHLREQLSPVSARGG